MKKFIFTLTLFGMIFLSVSAATIDNTPPVMKSIKVLSNEVKPGDYVELEIEVNDDVSGVDKGSVGLYSPVKGYTVYQMDIEDFDNPKFKIPENALGGTYILDFITLFDKSKNIITYSNKKLDYNANEGNLVNFGNDTITIVSDKKETDKVKMPVLTNISLSKEEISLGETVTLCAEVSSESNITIVGYDFTRSENVWERINGNLEYNSSNGKYCKDIKPTKTGEYLLRSISVYDEYDNMVWNHTPQDGGILNSDTNVAFERDYKIKVNGLASDEEAPKLKSVKLNKEIVIAPGTIKMYIDAEDNSGEISGEVFARFISKKYYDENVENGTYSDGEISVFFEYDPLLNKYVGEINLNQYVNSGKYYLQYMSLTDESQNTACYYGSYKFPGTGGYSGNLKTTEKIDDLSFEVQEEFKYDVVTSTINKDIIDIIKKQKDDAVIMIDATNNYEISADIFEAIKDTNKTIYIEANGYQWVFKGKDIKNPKTINVMVRSELLVDENINNANKEYVALVFEDNGLLPGKAKIRVKIDYTFRYVEGYKDLVIYYYNDKENRYQPLGTIISLSKDGFYEFDIEHNSTYVLSNKKIDKELLTEKGFEPDIDKKQSEKHGKVYIYIGIGAAITVVGVIGSIIIYKKRKNNKINKNEK